METLEMFFHDPYTGELWKSFFPRNSPMNRGPKLLRLEPLPESLEMQLERCLTSNEEADSMGLGIELSANPEKWPEIITLLKKNSSNYHRSNFFIFLKYSGLLKPLASLDELGEKPETIGTTQKELKRLRRQAKFIKFKRFFGF
jgi:hypothetical protein